VRFDTTGIVVADSGSENARDLIVQDKTKGVDAVDADVADGSTSCNLRIVDPRAGGGRGIQELGEENLESL
jgi:hypothetical protein